MAAFAPDVVIAAAGDAERAWITRELTREFSSPLIYSAYRMFDTNTLPALVARRGGKLCGLACYRIDRDECELVAFLTTQRSIGVGSAMIAALRALAVSHGCRRLFLTTSNDNLAAMRFYQKRGFRFARVHQGSMDEGRKLIPSIPLQGHHGIRMRDDIEFEMALPPTGAGG